jgi:hypothetical protein
LLPTSPGSLTKEAIAQPPKSSTTQRSTTPADRNPLVLPPPGSR